MKSLFMVIIGAVFLLCSLQTQSNQDKTYKEGIAALKKCSQLYLDLKRFSVDIEYAVFYGNSNFLEPNDIEYGQIIRNGQQFYQNEAGRSTIINNDYQIYFDNTAEVISIANRTKESSIPKQFELDSLENYIHFIQKIDEGYQYIFESGPIEKMDFIFTSNGYLQKMRSHYRYSMDFGDGATNVVTQISYKNFNRTPQIESNFFSERKYVTILKSGEVKPVEKYKNYHVLNQLQTK